MSKQPEALRLADAMDAVNKNNADSLLVQMAARSAAAELRRLYWDELRVREHRDEMCAEVTRLHAEVERLRKLVPDVEFAREAIYGKAEGREA